MPAPEAASTPASGPFCAADPALASEPSCTTDPASASEPLCTTDPASSGLAYASPSAASSPLSCCDYFVSHAPFNKIVRKALSRLHYQVRNTGDNVLYGEDTSSLCIVANDIFAPLVLVRTCWWQPEIMSSGENARTVHSAALSKSSLSAKG